MAHLSLYHVQRMRLRHFDQLTLQAVRDMQGRNPDTTCLRDQSIINILHSFRTEFGYSGLSPVMILPCKWSVFPTTEWLSYWNSPERWLPELRERRRYPGLVSVTHVELFCPDEMDILSAWAFLPMTEDLERHERLRAYSLYEGRKKERYCSPQRATSRCCMCGERVSLLHIAGDMKNWPAMQALLRAYLPPFKDMPLNPFDDALSRVWTGGSQRLQKIQSQTTETAVRAAKMMGLQALFGRCTTLRCQASDIGYLDYVVVPFEKLSLPTKVEVETTAANDVHVLIGIESHSGLELVVNGGAEKASCLRWVRSAPASKTSEAWSMRREIMCVPYVAEGRIPDEEGFSWKSFSISLDLDGLILVQFPDAEFGNFLPEEPLNILKARRDLTISIGTFYKFESKWSVCLDDAEKLSKRM